jgi:arylsulfatase A-like enzyme
VQVSNVFSDIFTPDDLTMDELMLADIDGYFAEGKMSQTAYGENIYTGALRGKNLVVIVVESGEWFTINQEYTPTLYALATQGLSFTNYHARDKTNHSEAMSILGSYPGFVSGVDVKGLKGHNLSFTLPNMLRDQGYTANYFHANEGSFYDRDKTHGSNGYFGYDKGHFLDNMKELDGYHYKRDFYDFDKETQLFDNYFEEYTYTKDGSDKFYTMHMTLSSHGHYDDLIEAGDYPFTGAKNQEALKKEFSASDNRKVKVKGFEKYYEVIDSYPETYVAEDKGIKFGPDVAEMTETEKRETYLRFKRYQAGMMDLDEGLNTLISDLQASGKLDDTAFFLYSDHSAYYHDLNYHLKGVSAGEFWNAEVYNIPCIVWYGGSMNCNVTAPEGFYEGYNTLNFTATKDLSSSLQGKTRIDKFACSFDIIPTILQLVGIDHNLNMYHGVSMLTENASSIFVSLESGIFTNEYYYDGMTVFRKETDGTWTEFDYEELTESEEGLPEDVQTFLDKSVGYYTRQDAFNKIYKLDYYRYRALTETYQSDGKNFTFIKK